MKKHFLSYLLLIISFCLLSCGNEKYYYKDDSVNYIGLSSNIDLDIEGLISNQLVSPFNTVIYIRRFKNNKNFDDIKDVINDNYQLLHSEFDCHYNYLLNGEKVNNLKVINDSYGKNENIKVSKDLYDILKKSVELTKLSEGKFNISVGSLTNLWNDYFEYGNNCYVANMPSEEEIQKALSNVISYEDIDKVIEFIDDENEIKLNKIANYDEISLTLGAVGKGYSTKRMEKILKELLNNKEYSYISAGESSISLLTSSPFNEWTLELSNPLYRQLKKKNDSSFNDFNAYELQLKKEGVFSFSTSGNYENFIYNEEGLYHHIIDPTTGYSCQYFDSISVVCNDSFYADAITTTLMNMDLKEGIKFVKLMEETYHIEVYPIWFKIGNDNTIQVIVDSTLEDNISLSKDNDLVCSEIQFIDLNH